MNLTNEQACIVGYLLENGDSKAVTLCVQLGIKIIPLHYILDSLIARGIVDSRGYAAHVDEYYVVDSEGWRMSGRARSYEELGKAYARDL